MQRTEHDELKAELWLMWMDLSAYTEREKYFQKVRQSKLSAEAIGQLRDSLEYGSGMTGERLNTLRSCLDGIYKEKVRKEDKESKPKIIRFIEKHPTIAVLLWILTCVASALIGMLVDVVFDSPLKNLGAYLLT